MDLLIHKNKGSQPQPDMREEKGTTYGFSEMCWEDIGTVTMENTVWKCQQCDLPHFLMPLPCLEQWNRQHLWLQ